VLIVWLLGFVELDHLVRLNVACRGRFDENEGELMLGAGHDEAR
jgi:hypothetical protein